MSRRRLVLTALAVVVIAAACWAALARTRPLPQAPLANVPAGATAVLRVDVGAVLGSTLWREMVTAQGRDEGLARMISLCGFSPLDQIEDVVAFASGEEAASLDHVGFVARGPIDHEALAECVGKVVQSEGGSVRRADVDGVPAVAGGRGDSRAAFVGRRGIAWGSEDTVRRIIHTVRDDAPSMQDDAELAGLWSRVAQGRDVVLVGRVPERWRRVVARYVSQTVAEGAEAMGSVHRLGFGATVRGGLSVGGVLVTGEPSEAIRLAAWIQGRLDEAQDSALLALSPVGAALRSVRIEGEGSEVVVHGQIRDQQLESALQIWRRMSERRAARARERAAPPADLRAPAPDEVLRPGSGAAAP